VSAAQRGREPSHGRLTELYDIAERLFSERGYAAVSLRDIAEAVGVRQASLYHYVPGGKEALYVEVTERGLRRTEAALKLAHASAAPSLRVQLRAAASVLLAQPPFDAARMVRSDMPAISTPEAERLTHLAFESLIEPLAGVFRGAIEDAPAATPDHRLLAGLLLAIVETAQVATRFTATPAEDLATALVDLIVDGLEYRHGSLGTTGAEAGGEGHER
jgi:AcrR family transcriptional regulator